MATYAQALRSRRVSRGYWVFGEPYLAEDAVVRLSERCAAGGDVVWLSSEMPEVRVWEELDLWRVRPTAIVVREAERLERLERLRDWLEEPVPGVHVLCTARSGPPEVLEGVPSLGVVRCSVGAEQLLSVVRALDPRLDEQMVKALVGAAYGSPQDVLAAVRLLGFVRTDHLSAEVCRELVPDRVSAQYVDALVAMRVREAISAAPSVVSPRRVLGLLSFRLQVLARLNRALRALSDVRDRSRRTRELMAAARVDGWLVRLLLPYARWYVPEQVQASAQALLLADRYVDHPGVLEVLAVMWGFRG
jgi:hypothetical protein